MSRFALACLCAFAFGLAPAGAQTTPSSPAPSAATAPSPEAIKLVDAMSKVRSFRAQISSPAGVAVTVTFVRLPARRTKIVVVMGSMINESVGADGRMYTRINGGDWHVVDLPPSNGMTEAALQSTADASRIRILPDRVENGTTVGVYEVTPAVAGAASASAKQPMSCTYDKATYLPRTCTVQTVTQTFEGWNDAANVVDVPVVASPKP
jgi:hypothetical protein